MKLYTLYLETVYNIWLKNHDLKPHWKDPFEAPEVKAFFVKSIENTLILKQNSPELQAVGPGRRTTQNPFLSS